MFEKKQQQHLRRHEKYVKGFKCVKNIFENSCDQTTTHLLKTLPTFGDGVKQEIAFTSTGLGPMPSWWCRVQVNICL